MSGNGFRCWKALFKIYRHTGYKIFRRNIILETKNRKGNRDSFNVLKMKKADYIVIALFVTANCLGALLWSLYIHPFSVLILYFSTLLVVRYCADRYPWWKKKNERNSEGGA